MRIDNVRLCSAWASCVMLVLTRIPLQRATKMMNKKRKIFPGKDKTRQRQDFPPEVVVMVEVPAWVVTIHPHWLITCFPPACVISGKNMPIVGCAQSGEGAPDLLKGFTPSRARHRSKDGRPPHKKFPLHHRRRCHVNSFFVYLYAVCEQPLGRHKNV